MKKHKLSVEEEVDFLALAIVSTAKDYQLCYQINNVLGINLDKSAVIRQFNPKTKQLSDFQGYIYSDKENSVVYYIVNNKEEGKILLPKLKQADFVCFLAGMNAETKLEDCLKLFGKIQQVQKVFIIESEHLNNIIIE